ncbi:hypothetical protein RRX38_23565 [Pseudomonas sp. DTU_2021_1001937_2_SI_NGA_ILE_001]|nr:hypothetical protein [Pseudomonas sp. DTU_2021_1001937_2_SI_NGA_ILE_001]WNW14370.1 hypothetical protein RRX38_23565 [Pseudomonas sp. DTU_2021_1001937_2_SI_NGA_ILE_001]
MNMILTTLNAATLVALVAFHFLQSPAQPVQQVQVQTGVHQVPQLAIMAERPANPAMLTNDAQQMPQATGSATQRWVF